MRTYGSLFSGIGGLDLGVEEATGARPVWQCDSDPAARAVLAQHWPGVRIYDNVADIDEQAERADILIGGFPCQPHSVAGRRQGTTDERWLWPQFARVMAAIRPSLVFVENVPGLRTSGLRELLSDLAGLGFDAEWDGFSAAETGAPHERERLYLLAYSRGDHGRLKRWWAGRPGRQAPAVAVDDGVARTMAGPPGAGAAAGTGEAPDADGLRLARRADDEAAAGAARRDAPQGDNPWASQSGIRRVAHGVPARVDRLRLLGNAAVPPQAALAFRVLAERAVR